MTVHDWRTMSPSPRSQAERGSRLCDMTARTTRPCSEERRELEANVSDKTIPARRIQSRESAIVPVRFGKVKRIAARLGLASLLALSACNLIEPEIDYLSNRDILEEISRGAAFRIDPTLFVLRRAVIEDDSLTLHYTGVAHEGDEIWVVRFSQKTTEQDPAALADLYSLLAEIEKGRNNFTLEKDDEVQVDSAKIQYATYNFESPVRDDAGVPLTGHGVVGTLVTERSGQSVVYKFNLFNWGDRDALGIEDLDPFVEQMVHGDS